MLGLVGEGQEIHTGEEAGIAQWRDAIRAANKQWTVVCPLKLENIFIDICEVKTFDKLDLNVTLRSHLRILHNFNFSPQQKVTTNQDYQSGLFFAPSSLKMAS